MSRAIDIEIGGKAHKVRFDFNAIADIEQRTGMGIGKLMSEDNAGFHSIRVLLWGGMKFARPRLTFEDAGNLLQQYLDGGGTFEAISQRLVLAMQIAGLIPKDEVTEEPEGNENPGE